VLFSVCFALFFYFRLVFALVVLCVLRHRHACDCYVEENIKYRYLKQTVIAIEEASSYDVLTKRCLTACDQGARHCSVYWHQVGVCLIALAYPLIQHRRGKRPTVIGVGDRRGLVPWKRCPQQVRCRGVQAYTSDTVSSNRSVRFSAGRRSKLPAFSALRSLDSSLSSVRDLVVQ